MININKTLNENNVEDVFQALLDVFHDVHHMYIHFKNTQLGFPESMRESFLIAAHAVDDAASKHHLALEFPPRFLQY